MSQASQVRGRPVGFGHVGIQVSQLDRSVRYYCDLIGLELVERRRRGDAYLSQVVGYPDIELDIALVREPSSGTQVELLEYPPGLGTPVDPATANPGTGHVCFIADDVDMVYARVVAAGYGAVNAPVTPTAGRWAGGRAVYLLDPDDVRVELVQPGPLSAATGSPPR